MAYGEGRGKKELARIAREYAKSDDDKTYVVTTAKGTRLIANGINSAKALAGKDGTYQEQ